MVESCVMVNPHGRFFRNGQRQFGYAYSAAILDVGAKEAVTLSRLRVDTRRRK